MKVNKNQALLILGGASAALAGKGIASTTTVHADTNKTTKVSTTKDNTTQSNSTGQSVTKIDSSKSNAQSDMEIVTVVSGDTTWEIAQQHNTTVDQIVKDNDLENGGALIHIGEQLKVRADDGTNKQATASTTTAAQQSTTTTNDTTATTPTSGSTQQTQTTQTAPAQSAQSSYSSSNYSGYTSNSGSQSTYSSTTRQVAPTQSRTTTQKSTYKSNVAGNEAAAKEWIAARESGGSYTARNASSGAYGRYQLLPGYLNGDYSPANQEKVADNYVKGRYGSWTNAKAFWQSHNWY